MNSILEIILFIVGVCASLFIYYFYHKFFQIVDSKEDDGDEAQGTGK